VTAWLLLPENSDPAAIVLELAFVHRHERVRRYRVTPLRESIPMPHGHAPTLPRRGRASGV
jgi:hypothetical protein